MALNRTRTWSAFAGLTAAVLLLAGCGSGTNPTDPSASPSASESVSAAPSESASASPTVEPTTVDNLDVVSVTGDPGTLPTVTGPFPFIVPETLSKVLTAGTGAEIGATDELLVDYVGVNARTGDVFDSSYSRGAAKVFPLDSVIPGFSKGLVGKHVGDQVLIAVPGADGYDGSGGVAQADIQVGDTLLFVVDIHAKALNEATGTAVTPPAGLPTVTFADGQPTVAIPASDPPTTLVVQPLIQGDGAVVAATDTIRVRYAQVDWATGAVQTSTYGADPEEGPLSSLIAGWQQAIVGQNVGSRLLIIVPPDLAYPNGTATPSIAPNSTLVFVVDLLFAYPA